MRPIIGLLTDFGTRDHYVGAMKGAILTVCPDAQLVDILHEVPAHDIESGAFALAAAHSAFPAGTVFVGVVDPGVGSTRRALAVEAGGWRFVAPDNGLLTLVLADHPSSRIHAITNAGLFRYVVSSTFHGRDVFGPVAGHLARGLPLEAVGPPVADPCLIAHQPARMARPGEWEGAVLQIDRFGDLTTNITARDLQAILATVNGDPTEVVIEVQGIVLPLVDAYASVSEGEPCALLGSSGRLEVAIHGGSAARVLGATRGARVRVRVVAAGHP